MVHTTASIADARFPIIAKSTYKVILKKFNVLTEIS